MIMHWRLAACSLSVRLSLCLFICLSCLHLCAGRLVAGCVLTLEMFLNAKVFPGSAEPCLQLFCPFLRKLQFLPWMIDHCFVSDASFFKHQQKSVGWGLFIINDNFTWHFHIWQISTDRIFWPPEMRESWYVITAVVQQRAVLLSYKQH